MDEPLKAAGFGHSVIWRFVQVLAAGGLLIGVVASLTVVFVFLGPFDQFVDSLDTVSLEVSQVEDTLNQTSATLDQLVDVLDTTTGSIDQIQLGVDDLDKLLVSVSEFLSGEAPDTIEAVHDALASTQEGARAMDQVLRGLATVSFLTGVEYDPEQSLDASLADVAESLSPLPQSLRQVSGDLDGLQANLDQLDQSLASMLTELPGLQTELENSSQTLKQNANFAGRLADDVAIAAARLQKYKLLWAFLSLFITLNFSAIQWAVWQFARYNNPARDSEATQPTSAGAGA